MKLRAFLLAISITLPAAAFAAERGVFGFGMEVESEGLFLNPTLRSIKIVKVVPLSPAALAGIKVGDEVVEVAGRLVAGAKGRDIQNLTEKEVGQSLSLKVKHVGGEVASITMVAVEKASPK
jgi:C-terminal processing protease CtpA/Prc